MKDFLNAFLQFTGKDNTTEIKYYEISQRKSQSVGSHQFCPRK